MRIKTFEKQENLYSHIKLSRHYIFENNIFFNQPLGLFPSFHHLKKIEEKNILDAEAPITSNLFFFYGTNVKMTH